MGKQRDRLEAWFTQWRGVRTPEEEATVLDIADSHDIFIESGKLSADRLGRVVDAASSSRSLLWMNAMELLGDLTVECESAAQAVAEMFDSKKSHVRFVALCCLLPNTPAIITDRLLRGGLTDRSSRVRKKAAQRIYDFERKDFLPELEAAFSQETNSNTRGEIELHLLLLRDGYIVEPSNPSGFDVTVRIEHGIRTGYVTEEEMQEKGIDAVAAELRNS